MTQNSPELAGDRGHPPSEFIVQGRAVPLPVVVRDAASITAIYLVPAAEVRRLVRHPELRVPELFPGRAVCVLAAVEYRDNDLGQYNEFAVNFFVTQGRTQPRAFFGFVNAFRQNRIGAYVHWLPVTTTFSRDAGRDIWGFPKTVEQIEFRDEGGGRRRTCTVVSQGRHVLTLTAPSGGRGRMKETPQDAFALRDGVLYRTPSVMSGEGVGWRPGGAEITLGDHPVAQDLRRLGFPRRPLVTVSTARMRAAFQAPLRLGSS